MGIINIVGNNVKGKKNEMEVVPDNENVQTVNEKIQSAEADVNILLVIL